MKRRTLSSALVLSAAVFSLAVPGTDASAAVGDCKTVYGKGGKKAKKGYANVCLTEFSGSMATLRVKKQVRQSAPQNIYVKAGFGFGGYNTGVSRLGPNAPKKYTETIETGLDGAVGVVLKLCYDKTLKKDPCFKSTFISDDEGDFE